ncbi:MAG: hypothetical protein ACPHAS_08990, partial [Synechococcus sp.]
TIAVEKAWKDPAVVSWAEQSLEGYDLDHDFSVAFRLRHQNSGAWRVTDSSRKAVRLDTAGSG